jgi:hypothetical protein
MVVSSIVHFSHAAYTWGSTPHSYVILYQVQNETQVTVYFTITTGSEVRHYVSIQRGIHFDAWRELRAG